MLDTSPSTERDFAGGPPFAVAVHPDRAQVVVAPSGELDLATAPEVERELTKLRLAGFTDIVVDLRSVTFLDSSGLRMLLGQARAAQREDDSFRLIGGSAEVRRVFELTGTTTAFQFVAGP